MGEPAASDDAPDAADEPSAGDAALPPKPVLNDDAAPVLPAPYARAASDAMPPSLVADDNRTGKVITILLCGLFFYTIFAMGYVVYQTYLWTR